MGQKEMNITSETIKEKVKDALKSKLKKALEDEGGAAGMKALMKHTKAPEEDIKKAVKDMKDVGQHPDEDYILGKGKVKITEDMGFALSKHANNPAAAFANLIALGSKPERLSQALQWIATNTEDQTAGIYMKGIKEAKLVLGSLPEGMDNLLNENEYLEMLSESETIEEAKYKGRKVKLNKPTRGDVKKFKVYVKNAKGNVVKVNFGDKKMRIKKSNPKRRKSFRARHNCDNPGPKWKARYWSCKKW